MLRQRGKSGLGFSTNLDSSHAPLVARVYTQYRTFIFPSNSQARFIKAMKRLQRRRLGNSICVFCGGPISKPSRRAFASATSGPEIYDVVAVGGGPVGLGLLSAISELSTMIDWGNDLTFRRIVFIHSTFEDGPYRSPGSL